ncbi:MAG: competence/damage-inducible protein A [Pelagibacteraceae bacterium]|jgi:molybdenum cofactor synthesis domain-containing protein|nr:competence/damage-inducible protein A [Pelagibacteraceae bacterium]
MSKIKIAKKKINAAILIIGNEILSGRTQDSNVSFISTWLNLNCGILIEEVRIIPDIEKKIIINILDLCKRFKYVFTTGGIGPTHDDITALSVSKAFKVKYDFNQEAYRILENFYGKKNFNDARKKMAKMPSGSKLIYNPSSAAPGFMIKNVLCLPGVPSILKSMMPNLKDFLIRGVKIQSKTISIQAVESKIADDLAQLQKKYLKKIEIGSYPFFRLGKVGVSIVIRSTSMKLIQKCEIELLKRIKHNKINLLFIK